MESIKLQILACYNAPFLSSVPATEKKAEITTFQTRLAEAVNVARGHLQEICDDLDAQKRISSGHVQLPRKVVDSCTCTILLLQVNTYQHDSSATVIIRYIQMAQELQFGLTTMQDIRVCHDESRLRLWHPRFSLAWLGVTPTMVSTDEGGTFLDDDTPGEANVLSETEALEGIAERTFLGGQDDDYIKHLTTKKARITGSPLSTTWFKSLFYSTWNHPKTLKSRLRLSRSLKSLQRSPHLRHAFKNGAGVALLSLPAFMAIDNSGEFEPPYSF